MDDLDAYESAALALAVFPEKLGILYPILGLCGEAGETAEKIKKVLRDKDGIFTDQDHQAIALELGDVLWYLTNLAHQLGYTLADIGRMNIEKITSRKARGTLSGSGDAR